MGELLKQRPEACHKVDPEKGGEAAKQARSGNELRAGTIDGRAKMANMRSFVCRTERKRGAAQFITVTSSLVTDEEVDVTIEGEAGRTVKDPVFTAYTTGCSFVYTVYNGTVPCFLSFD